MDKHKYASLTYYPLERGRSPNKILLFIPIIFCTGNYFGMNNDFTIYILYKSSIKQQRKHKETYNMMDNGGTNWQNPFAKDRLEDWRVEEFPENYKELVNCFAPPGFMNTLENPSITKALIIMGGRGSGKSHIIRMLSVQSVISNLKAKLNKKELITLDYNRGYFGVYIKSDCFFPLSTENISFLSIDQLNPIFEHLLNLQIGKTILDATQFFCSNFSDIPKEKEAEICRKITKRISILKGNSFSEIFDSFDNEISEIQNFVKLFPYEKDFSKFKDRIHFTNAPDFILDVFKIIQNELKILNDKSLFILIDEYEDLDVYQQKLINRLIKQRRLIFRIASKIKGIKTFEKIDEVHDYEIIPLHFDVSKETRPLYKRLVKVIFVNRLNLYEDVYEEKDPEILLPSPTLKDEDLTESEIQKELENIRNSLKKKKEIQNPEEYWKNFEGHYRDATIYRLLRKKGRDKLYAGFDQYAALSSGIVRLFIWLCRESFSLAHSDGIKIEDGEPISLHVQSRAALEVSKREITTTIPQNVSNIYGQKMARFIFDIGSILRTKLYFSTQPQANRIEIIDSEKFEIEKYKIPKELIESGLDLPIFHSDVAFKPRDVKYPMPESFSLNWIFAPILGISLEKRWRTEITVEEVSGLCSTERRQEMLENIIKQIEDRKRTIRRKEKQIGKNAILQFYDEKKPLNLSNCPITGFGCNQNLMEHSLSNIDAKAFLAIPFDSKSWINDPRRWIKESMHDDFKIRCVDVDDIDVKGGKILCKICSCARQMPIGLFEITELNPNVVFELGMSAGLNKINFLLVHKAKIPSAYKNYPPPPLEGIEYISYELSKPRITETIRNKILPTIEIAKKEQDLSCWVLRGNCPNVHIEINKKKIFIGLPLNRNDFFKEVAKLSEKLLNHKYQIEMYTPAKSLSELCEMCKEIRSSSFCVIDTTYNDFPMLFGLGIAFGRDKKFIQIHNISLGSERPISDLRQWAIEYTNLTELEDSLEKELFKRLGGF
jgi:hypothetical protein